MSFLAIVYFILLLGGLILVHEAGHFVMAKAMGVKVLVFSIGFGPSLIKWRRGDTEYRIAAVPLGGFVKMFGDEVGEEFPKDEAPKIYGVTAGRFVIVDADRAFNSKPLWRRTLIVLAGPVSNLVLPLLVFIGLYFSHSEVVPSYIGSVEEGGPAWEAGVRPGDSISAIDGEAVSAWWQMERRIQGSEGRALKLSVRRGDSTFETSVVPEEIVMVRHGQLGLEDRSWRIQVASQAVHPVIWVREGSAPYMAGLRTFDRILTVDSKRVRFLSDAEGELALPGAHVVEVAREKALGFLGHAAVGLYADRGTATLQGPVAESDLASAEMVVHTVDAGSAAGATGLKTGDRIVSVDDRKFILWALMEAYFSENLDKPHAVAWLDERGVERTGELQLAPEKVKGELNEEKTVVVFGAYNHSTVGFPDPVPNDDRLAYTLVMGLEDTAEAFRVTIAGLAGLFVGKVPLKEMGGPILIYSMAARTVEEGWNWFFFILAWLSINLGIINLIPIPILDGGHLLFFAIEAVIRRPVPVKVRQLASWAGLIVILVLMLFVIYNDVDRNWGPVSDWF